MKRLALGILVLLPACLDYEIEAETVVGKDGAVERTVRIHEKSDKHKTWRRYGKPGAPYEVTGDDASGFVAKAKLKPGEHAGGIRVVKESEGGPDYEGEKESEGKPVFEGRVAVLVDDIEIGTLYRYRETIDLGFDPVLFRNGLESVVEIGAEILVTAIELAEPEVDFRPVRDGSLPRLVPQVTRALLAIHAQFLLLEQKGVLARGEPLTVDEVLAHPEVRVMLAELGRLGIRRKPDAPKATSMEGFLELENWTIRESLWKRLLEPVEGADEAFREKLWDALTADDGKEGKSDAEDRAEQIWKDAVAKVFPEENAEPLQKELRYVLVAGMGAPFANDLFDSHRHDLSVRLPGRVLVTNGLLRKDGSVAWHYPPSEGRISNPVAYATAFAPSDAMVGRIVSATKLERFADWYDTASKEAREEVRAFLARAKKSGLEAAEKIYDDSDNVCIALLADALSSE